MDWSSRNVLSWILSNPMDTDFCVMAFAESLSQKALAKYGKPGIVNTNERQPIYQCCFYYSLAWQWHSHFYERARPLDSGQALQTRLYKDGLIREKASEETAVSCDRGAPLHCAAQVSPHAARCGLP